MRQMVLANDDFHIHADFAGPSENLDYAAYRSEPALRISRQLHVHNGAIQLRQARPAIQRSRRLLAEAQFFAKDRRQFVARWNLYFVRDARVVWQHMVAVRAVAEQPDNRGIFAPHNLNNAALCTPVGSAALNPS